MSKKSRISFEIKIKYAQNYLAGKISISDVCKELNITRWAFYLWITKYDSSGAEGLCQTCLLYTSDAADDRIRV